MGLLRAISPAALGTSGDPEYDEMMSIIATRRVRLWLRVSNRLTSPKSLHVGGGLGVLR